MAHVADWQALARSIVARRVELGHDARETFAEASGIGARTLGDLETGRKDRYYPSTVARLERALEWPPGAAQVILDGGDAPDPGVRVFYGDPSQPPLQVNFDATPDAHPAVAELAELLAFDSPLSGETRARLTAALQVLFEAARRDFRDVPPSRESADMVYPRRPGVDLVVVTHPDDDHWSTGRALDAFLNPDTRIGERDREAIRRLMAAALQLGSTAMLAHDAQEDEPDPFAEMPVTDPREVKARDSVR